MREQTVLVVATSIEKFSANSNFFWVVNVGANSFLPLVAFSKLVEEHAILSASRLRSRKTNMLIVKHEKSLIIPYSYFMIVLMLLFL